MYKAKSIFLFIFLCTALPFFLKAHDVPTKIVDFGKFQPTYCTHDVENEPWSLGQYSFNSAPELNPYFAMLKQDYDLQTVVETGTFAGSTTVAFSRIFSTVHTIEIVKETYEKTKMNLQKYSNIHMHLGSSEKVLVKILPSLRNQRVLFYLDAHWESHWPLLEELSEIGKTHKDNCIIVIDDFAVPNRDDIPFDEYGEHKCSYDYVKARLDEVFSDYTIQYIIPKEITSRAKFVAIPTHFKSTR